MSPEGEEGWDRRRHVRVRPAADYDVVVQTCEGAIYTRAQLVDISLGGVGLLLERPVDGYAVGEALELRLLAPGAEPVAVVADVRHRARGVCGAEFRSLSEEAAGVLKRAVAELMERGNSA